ncbi:uncharacterized protein [Anabrus simplex]|uniref:uncharacterized protein n=1 Tax=Anabrus simplex TaxID=316456 RepID=UPI0035A35194
MNTKLLVLMMVVFVAMATGQSRSGNCPRVWPGTFGTCVEECSTDDACPGAQKCCSNGCGHTCRNPVFGEVTLSALTTSFHNGHIPPAARSQTVSTDRLTQTTSAHLGRTLSNATSTRHARYFRVRQFRECRYRCYSCFRHFRVRQFSERR